MIRVLTTVAIFTVIATTGKAQEPSKASRERFSSINVAGIGSGEMGESVVIQTVNGLAKGRWFGGVGLGIDYYGYRSIPLTLQSRYEVIPKTNALFAYADAGINFPWPTNNQQNTRGWPTVYESGLTYEGGLGWKLKGKNNRAFVLSCGYNYKQVREVVTVVNWAMFERSEQKEYYDNRFRRILIKIGIQF